jgi:predicted CoA-substrate-specific enzyme activase
MAEILVGIDIGAVTIKAVVLDSNSEMVFSCYEKHYSEPRKHLLSILTQIRKSYSDCRIKLAMTGSGGIEVADIINCDFYQEVIACKKAAQKQAISLDTIIDIGGEDSKIIFISNGIEFRMNNSCAAGTGVFLELMADTLNITFSQLSDLSKKANKTYPLVSRCGVFTKTDISNLLSQGAEKADIAKSLLNCIVNQVITVLSCGRKIKGNTGFIGGVFEYIPTLKNAFEQKLSINVVDIPNSNLFVALGVATLAQNSQYTDIDTIISKLNPEKETSQAFTLPPLQRRNKNEYTLPKSEKMLDGNAYVLGIDTGSTTTKIVVIDEKNEIVYSDYQSNRGENLKTLKKMLNTLYTYLPKERIKTSGITGYGTSYLQKELGIEASEVETIAHLKAATYYCPNVDSIIDIGGQDVKYIKIKDGKIEKLIINEACSSGAGVFLQNFANSLNIQLNDFADIAFNSEKPYDLGTRCTVFMNSKVKQAQKEGVEISDILAGLAYSVVKNTLNRVIKLRSNDELGKNVVVQGGTILNEAILSAFENITTITPHRHNNPQLMGAFGIALIAKESTQNKKSDKKTNLPNAFKFKRENIFNYTPLPLKEAKRGQIGLPRVLNMFENYPFWFTFFTQLGFRVLLSDEWTRDFHDKGLESVPSETVCYSAKTVHGHIANLVSKGVKLIFYPCIPHESYEDKNADKNFNCPIVATYPEVIKSNVTALKEKGVTFIGAFLPLGVGSFVDRILEIKEFESFHFSRKEILDTLKVARKNMADYRRRLREYGEKSMAHIKENNLKAVVVASRPYFIADEISHNIDKTITDMGMAVLTEDTICHLSTLRRPVRVYDQWTYITRLYNACDVVCREPNLQLVQLTAFGCGIDAISSEQIEEILLNSGKLYTLIKLDESANLSSVRIRLQSLKYVMENSQNRENQYREYNYHKADFTKSIAKKHTVICPNLHPLHTKFVRSAINSSGYNLVVLDVITQNAIEIGLKYVNNDMCYPAVIVIGQLLEAALSGKYDTENITLVISQSGCGCRDSNYIALLRHALDNLGLSHIPVLSFNYVGLEKTSGFKFTLKMNYQLVFATIYSDILTQLLLAIRPYETSKGATNTVYEKWVDVCNNSVIHPKWREFKQNIKNILSTFAKIEVAAKNLPKVAIVGETFLKYNPNSNLNLIELLEDEGCEVFLPSIMSFVEFVASREISSYQLLGIGYTQAKARSIVLKVMGVFHKVLSDELAKYPQFMQITNFETMRKQIERVVSHGNQNGEGWYLPAKTIDFIESGVYNAICVQPFGCLSNHVLGKGTAKRIRELYPKANILPLDYDGSISITNQINRIKMLVSLAKE